jgi:hypothetical protein
MMNTFDKLRTKWAADAEALLVGRTVVGVRWMTDDEVRDFGWYASAPIIFFDDETYLIAKRDDEGNDAGALATSSDDLPTMPVIRAALGGA